MNSSKDISSTNHSALDGLRAAVSGQVIGQEHAIEQLLVTYLAGGHCLLEGVPGIGKTRLARSFAGALGLTLKRVQFTPDLMPADITGSSVLDPKTNDFVLMPGPLFTDLLLADEINRTPPKTQAALLEAMQERQVTIDGNTHSLDPAFFVIATQNPIDFEGTYPLPEAQADRFLLRIEMGLPDAEGERRLYQLALEKDLLGMSDEAISPSVSEATARDLRASARAVFVAPAVVDYLQRLSAGVRSAAEVELGPSPRASLSLLRASQAQALVEGRDFVLPDDFQAMLRPCWGHRIRLRAEAELEGVTAARLLANVLSSVEVPRTVEPTEQGTAESAAGHESPVDREQHAHDE